MRTVFLSHSWRDGEFASRLCQELEDRGVRCWMAPRDIPAGATWGEVVAEAIDSTPGFLVLLSGNSLESEQVAREVDRAAQDKSKKLFPVRLEDNLKPTPELGFYLDRCQWTNLWDPSSLDADFLDLAQELSKLQKVAGGIGGHAVVASEASMQPLAVDEFLSGLFEEPKEIEVTDILRRRGRCGEMGREREVSLLLEELCCDLCWFKHVESGLPPESIDIDQEVNLGAPDKFADIRVTIEGQPPYFVEIMLGYSSEDLVASVRRNYRSDHRRVKKASKLILVIDESEHSWPVVLEQLERVLEGRLTLEVWDLRHFLNSVRELFDVEELDISKDSLVELRSKIREAKGKYAFGEQWRGDPVQANLLWHVGFLRARQLRERFRQDNLGLCPGKFSDVVILIAGISSFNKWVRDARDPTSARDALATFYSKARYEILSTGGLLYQFAGDSVYAFYGVPNRPAGYLKAALRSARAIIDLGESISNRWQRHLVREQKARGVHIGIVLGGDVHLVAMTPFAQARLGAVSDSMNIASRLVSAAGPGEILVGNTFYQRLDEETQKLFIERSLAATPEEERLRTYKLR